MEVFALFDDQSCEKITLEFLKPSNKGNRIDITYFNNVSDNIRESLDKGIKEAYVSALKYTDKIPDKIALLFRGFEKSVHGSSADLAFAVSFISNMVNQGNMTINHTTDAFFVTGVIGKDGEVLQVKGLKDKITAAIYQGQDLRTTFIYPFCNKPELDALINSDPEFALEVEKSSIDFIAVKSVNELFEILCGKNKVKKRKSVFVVSILGLLIVAVIMTFVLTRFQTAKKDDLSEATYSKVQAKSTEIKTNTVVDTPKASQTPETKVLSENKSTPQNSKSTQIKNISTPTNKIGKKINTPEGKQNSKMYVLETLPKNNAEGIPVNTDVTIKYSKVIANISPDDLFKYVDIVDSQNGFIGFANLRLEGSVISLQLRNLEPGTKYTVKLPEFKDWDRNSCPPYSFSFTTDKKEVNNIFNDGNISFKYPKEFQFEEKVLDTEYSAKYKNVKLDLRYYKYKWPSIEEHLKSVQDDDNLNAPGVYQYSYTKNVLIRTASTNSDTLCTYCTLYTIGMGNKIAQITISADVPIDKLNHEEVEIMVDACNMISTHMNILDPTPCDQTIYGR